LIKEDQSWATVTDLACERAIVEMLAAATPDFGFYTEEEVVTPRERRAYTWLIDPIDGTHNFHYGLPCFAVQVALEHQGCVIAGAIALPAEGITVRAALGAGCWANGDRVRVSSRPSEAGLLLLENAWTDIGLRVAHACRSRFNDLRVIGSSCASLAYVAIGRADAVIAPGIKPWDVAAGSLMVQEAGGRVTNLRGGTLDLYAPDCMASNAIAHAPMLEALVCLEPPMRNEASAEMKAGVGL